MHTGARFQFSKACKDTLTDGWLVLCLVVYVCSDGTRQGFLGYSVCVFVNVRDWKMHVCVCVSEWKKKRRKLDFHFWCDAALLGCKQPWGHLTSLFINLLAQWKVSLLHLPPFSLCHISSLLPLPSPRRSLAAFLSPLVWTLSDVNEKARPLWFPLANEYERRGEEMMEVE